MIDLHTHVLYDVDDGAEDKAESWEMLRQYAQTGYTDIIITPHHDPNRYQVTADGIRDGVVLLSELAKEAGLNLNFYPGHEIQLQAQTPQMLQKGEVLTLNGSRYVLIELPFQTKPYYARELLYRIQLQGLVPIIAHPERYLYAQDDPAGFLDLVGPGCLFQMNLTSLVASPMIEKTALWFLDRASIHLVSTDAHSAKGRSPDQRPALDKLKAHIGPEIFEVLTQSNPEKVLENRHISTQMPTSQKVDSEIKQEEKGGFFQWIKNFKK